MAIEAKRTRRGCVIEIRDGSTRNHARHEFKQREDLRRFLVDVATLLVPARSSTQRPLRRQKLATITRPNLEVGIDPQGRIQLAFGAARFPSLHFIIEDGQARRMAEVLQQFLDVPQEFRPRRKKH